MTALVTHLLTAALVILTSSYAVLLFPARLAPLPPREGPAIAAASSWGYQLQNLRPRSIPDAIDLLVVDYARDGIVSRSQADVRALATRADGTRRTVLAYLSIGEAESYRWYWQPTWRLWGPTWLGPENKDWRGNYEVRYWDRDWQRLIVDPMPDAAGFIDKATMLFGLRASSFVDRIIAAGFDGVYLDRVDAYYQPLDKRPTARSDMIAFVTAISRYAKQRKPGFFVVPQNGEELLSDPRYRNAIDAIAKEDLLYGTGGDAQPNPEQDVEASVRLLNTLRSAGKPVFVVEYLNDPAQRIVARDRLASLGYRAAFAKRLLNEPPEALVGMSAPPAKPDRLPSQ